MSLVSSYAATYDLSSSGGGQLPVTSGFYNDTSAFYGNTWNDCNYLHLNHYSELDSGGNVAPTGVGAVGAVVGPRVRVVKRRNTANKKERRRTMSINNAFAELRDCIPNVPADTKLSKIKTLRLATSYISYLMAVLEAGDSDIPFRAELGRTSKHDKMQQQQQQQQQHHQHHQQHQQQQQQQQQEKQQQHLQHHQYNPNCLHKDYQVEEEAIGQSDKRKGRTGWPHHVWALELKQ